MITNEKSHYKITADGYTPPRQNAFERNMLNRIGKRNIFLIDILKEVSEISGLPLNVLCSKTRKREVVDIRDYYYKRAKNLTKYSLAAIGRIVGKDHSTVLHGIRKINNTIGMLEEYEVFFGERMPKVKPGKYTSKSLKEAREQSILQKEDEINISLNRLNEVSFSRPYSGFQQAR